MKLSVIIPTFNNSGTIRSCIESVMNQKMNSNEYEIIIIDGGSSDNTISTIEKINSNIRIFPNEKKYEEYAKVIGVNKSEGEFLVFIDADNILLDYNLFNSAIHELKNNNNINICEPTKYGYLSEDGLITKYISIMGSDDPIAFYMDYYDRYSVLTNKLCGGGYNLNSNVLSSFDLETIPPFGANVSFMRKEELIKIKYSPFVHTDIIYRLLKINNNILKIESKIVHRQSNSVIKFLKKKIRRYDRNYSEFEREYYPKISQLNKLKGILKIILILPLIADTAVLYLKTREKSILIHPLLTILTLNIFFYYRLKNAISKLF